MNGAESLVHTLLNGDVNVCFANPGTSEMHFVSALDRVEGVRCILGLFEGVVTGAADGYYRMAGKPAATLLHLGPGLGNGLANLHNAKKARSGIVNIVGEHASFHLEHDAPLTADIEGVARPMSHWVKTCASAQDVAADGALAIEAARAAPGQIATLILPADIGRMKQKPAFTALFSQSATINTLSLARFFLFGARDVWFVVALPVFLEATLGWRFWEVGAFMGLWVIGYGVVQGSAPALRRAWGQQRPPGAADVYARSKKPLM